MICNILPALQYTMTVRQLAVLIYLSQNKKAFLRKVARDLKIPPAGTCRAYDGLERLGFIERLQSEQDGRDVFGVLTEEGEKFLRRIK